MSLYSGIREGLAQNLSVVFGTRAYSYMPDNPIMPCAVSAPVSIQFDAAFNRGHDDHVWEVVVYAQRTNERTAQDLMDEYCDPLSDYSIKTVIESDPTLGGAVINCMVTDMSAYEALTVGEVQYLAATFRLSIIAN